MMNPTAKYKERIITVQRWLTASGWTVHDSAFNDTTLVERAVSEFGYKERRRAQILIAKAARLLRGEYVQVAGGAPRKNVAEPVDDLTPQQREKYLN